MERHVVLQLVMAAIRLSPVLSRSAPAASSDDDVIVSLAPGQQLRGFQGRSDKGDVVYTFYGIPYAAPPLGSLRFQPPEPAVSWTGVKDAVVKRAICHPTSLSDNSPVSSEDCLYLNVFSPKLNSSLPVFVWIHGGGFRSGSAFGDGDGATIAPRGIVTVTINYRLGALGFFSTGDEVMPGNYGLLDQVLALQWVQKNIRSFGGDPEQVTIGGESAGAHSVSLLNVSPLAKGLFKRVIQESGSSLALRALERPGTKIKVKESTLLSAVRVGCNQSKSSEILSCLQKVDVQKLINASQEAITIPRVETNFGFLPDDPENLLKTSNFLVDTLRGTNSGEFSSEIKDPENDGVELDQFKATIANALSRYTNADEIAKLVTDLYADNETDPISLRTNLVQAVVAISYDGATLLEMHNLVRRGGKHFMYEFDYRASDTSTPEWRGVDHAAERRFVFYPDSRYNYSAADQSVAEKVQTMWANFIKFGDPTPPSDSSLVKWQEFTGHSPKMLKINSNIEIVDFPKPSLIPLFERVLEIMQMSSKLNGED